MKREEKSEIFGPWQADTNDLQIITTETGIAAIPSDSATAAQIV